MDREYLIYDSTISAITSALREEFGITEPIRLLDVPEMITRIKPDNYEGEYELTPSKELQSLQTRDKTLRQNVTVKAIDYAEVSNESGTTVTIGG